jgi:hypothetical protein
MNWNETARSQLLFGSREPGGRFLDGDLPALTPRRRYSRPPGRANAGPQNSLMISARISSSPRMSRAFAFLYYGSRLILRRASKDKTANTYVIEIAL